MNERTPPPRRTPNSGREPPQDPFINHQTSLPAWRVRLPLPVHQRRILLLFVIALLLAVIGAIIGTRLFSRPRKVRSSVTADLRVLDARLSDVVSCLGGPGARVEEGKLARRILERALAEESWPRVASECRDAAMQLFTAASATAAAAKAASGRLPDLIQKRYQQALLGAERLLSAVGHLVDDVHEGRRVPSLPHADGVARALFEMQTALGALERVAESENPRSAVPPGADSRPAWPEAVRLAADLHYGPTARLAPFGEWEGRQALALLDPGSQGPLRLLLRPLDEAQWLALPALVAPGPKEGAPNPGAGAGDATGSRPGGTAPAGAPAPPPARAPAATGGHAPGSAGDPAKATTQTPPRPRDRTLRWLDLDLAEGTAPTPTLLYARVSLEHRTGRTLLHVGHFPPSIPEAPIAWSPSAPVATTAWAGLIRGQERLVLLGAPRGLGLVIAQVKSKDGGKTYDRPIVLAEDADPRVPPQLVITQDAPPLLVYAPLGGGLALRVLAPPAPPPAPGAPGAPPPPPHGSGAAPAVIPLPVGPAGWPLLGLCRTTDGRVYLLDGQGRPWAGTLPHGPFAPLRPGAPGATLPGPQSRSAVRLACFAGRAALAWSDGGGIFHYTTCDATTCGKPERISFSRLDDVLLAATRRSVLVLARDSQVIFQRRDPGGTGLLGGARPVALLGRPVQAWSLVPGHDAQRLALLLLDGGLGRLRTADGGRRWTGE